jgi:hypothetical protein
LGGLICEPAFDDSVDLPDVLNVHELVTIENEEICDQ